MKVFPGFCVILVVICVRDSCGADDLPVPKRLQLSEMLSKISEDYVVDEKLGRIYRLMYEAAAWEDARASCAQRGGKLATLKNMYEFRVIQRLVRRMRFPSIKGGTGTKLLAWVGISSLEDWRVWKDVDGMIIKESTFPLWMKGNGGISSDLREPHCAGVDAVNLLRDYWCVSRQPYICQFERDSASGRNPKSVRTLEEHYKHHIVILTVP